MSKLTKEEKQARKAEKKARWAAQKAAMKAEKLARKNRYKDAPFLVKFWHKVVKRLIVFTIILAIAVCGSGFYLLKTTGGRKYLKKIVLFIKDTYGNDKVSKKEIYKLSPLDEVGGKKIDALGDAEGGDTWTIAYYMSGSNLEDMDEVDLSPLTQLITNEAAQTNQQAKVDKYNTLIGNYTKELEENGLDYPELMYEPQHPVASNTVQTTEVVVADRKGCASTDLSEIFAKKWPDNVRIIIQTGGARRWSNSMVNPNKTQRFEYYKGVFREIENLPLQDSCDPDTLADFMSFCSENYTADHNMLVLWDHGGGAFGYGHDTIFKSGMSLKDIQTAMKKSFKANPEKPYYDLVGFDACLMASTEVIHTFYGYAKYFAGSEESEPGDGWDHTSYLELFEENSNPHPAQLARVIADSYMDYYMTQNVNLDWVGIKTDVTFSIMDVNATENVYQAYSQLNDKILSDAVNNIEVLTKVSRAAKSSTRYGSDTYRIINTIDLGNYMENLKDIYPEEAGAVGKALDEAVLYNRASGYLSESTGLNIYMPVDVVGSAGIQYALDYINNICEDDATKALYYYKISGFLNEELTKYVKNKGYGIPLVLDTKVLKQITALSIQLGDAGYSVELTDEQRKLTEEASLEVGLYNKKEKTITYYGHGDDIDIDGNKLSADFDGKWICMDGKPLALEIVSSTDTTSLYRSPVSINGSKYYLLISYNFKTGEVNLNSIQEQTDDEEGATYQIEHVVQRTSINLEAGDKIAPIYKVQKLEDNSEETGEGDSFTYTLKTKLSMEMLPSGTYLSTIVVKDIRGDQYYSGVVEHVIKKGKLRKPSVNEEFYGSAW